MGLRSDSSALVIVHRRERMMRVASVIELRPESGAPLKPSAVVRRFADEMKRHGATYAVADWHYAETVREHLTEAGLSLVPGPSAPAEAYVRTRALLREGNLRLPRHDRLLQQMREVQGRPTAGGGMSIMHPRWAKGGHGDLVAALVLALWQLYGDEVPALAAHPGTAEHVLALKKARYEAFQEEAERPHWKPKAVRDRFWRK
jgi:hypothetical protein